MDSIVNHVFFQISTTLGQPVFLAYMGLIDAEGNPSASAAALTGATVGLFCVRMLLKHESLVPTADAYCRLEGVLEW